MRIAISRLRCCDRSFWHDATIPVGTPIALRFDPTQMRRRANIVPPEELVDVILATLKREYDWDVQPEWIVWLPGLVAGFNVACRAIGETGDEVLTTTPIYPPFLSAPRFAGRRLARTQLAMRGGRWRM